MIKTLFYKTRQDGVNLYRTYSDITPALKQLPTNIIYDCWVYKLGENGNETKEVDWEQSGVIDVENAPYTYVEVSEEEYQEYLKQQEVIEEIDI
jgi:hypothetical protein